LDFTCDNIVHSCNTLAVALGHDGGSGGRDGKAGRLAYG
jgi:hypothetical protein